MEKNKKNKKKIFIGLAIALALAIALFLPQNSAPDNSEKENNLISEEAFSNASSSENEVKNKQNSKTDEKKSGTADNELKNEEKTPKTEENGENKKENPEKSEKNEKNEPKTGGETVSEETSKKSHEISEKEKNDKKEEKTENSENPEKNEKNEKTTPKGHTCFLSVRCDTLVSNIGNMKPEKAKIVPSDGIVFAEKEVEFFAKESVFNVLKREMKKSGIHFEFTNTPVFGSAYIEGIANIYEFDCGELSGWMYKVNGEFPKFGCSQYILKDGDKIEWVYTCDLGKDVGENYGIGKQKDE